MRFSVLVLACVLATTVAIGTENEDQYQVLTPEDKSFKPIHELSVAEGMDLISEAALKPSRHERRLLIEGVQQPDLQAAIPTKFQIVLQGVGERFVQSKKHDFMALRVATQHIHAVSFALKKYKKGTDKVVTVPGYPIPADNGFETLSFVNNRQVHNKMLETIAGWFWIALADRNETQAGWKMGNVLHSMGDSFAGGHTHRSRPTGNHGSGSGSEHAQQQQQQQQQHSRFGDIDCSTSEVIMFNSMDVANWNNHLEPDLQTKDWRFHCLKKHIAQMVQFWKAGRPEVQKLKREDQRIATINTVMKKVGQYLCTNALKFNKTRLEWPAGGQVAGFSSLSELKMTKASKASWAHVNIAKIKKSLGGKGDQPILPIGLTTPELSEQFIKETAQVCAQQDEDNKKLKTVILHGFTYPTRSEPSYCDDPEYRHFQITGPVYTAINQGLAPKDHWVDWKGMGFRPDVSAAGKKHDLLDEVAGTDSWFGIAREGLSNALAGMMGVYHSHIKTSPPQPDAAAKAVIEGMIDGKAPYDN